MIGRLKKALNALRLARQKIPPPGALTASGFFGRWAARARRCVHAPPAGKRSLRLRLSLFFALFLLLAWLGAAFFAWLECRDYITEFFDTEQALFAQRLAETGFAGAALDGAAERARSGKKAARSLGGELEDDALGFAVFNSSGRLLAADGKHGRHFAFRPDKIGFFDERLAGKKGAAWRMVRLAAKDGGRFIAVGQEMDYRREMALEMLGSQITPWLALLPALLLGLVFILGRELAPLRDMACRLRARAPEDATMLEVDKIPAEALPMAEALNDFFSKTNAMLARERSFVSDAAHELRTPLAGLRVQAQVAAQAGLGKKNREEALGFLLLGIDRCARLVDQLLALSRLDSLGAGAPFAGSVLDLPALLCEVLREYRTKAGQKELDLDCELESMNAQTQGDPALIVVLLRNLLDNAVRYAPARGRIRILLESGRLTIENSAPELPEACAARLGERFFRPPGQEEPGSGLGLSIAKKIAEIHRFGLIVQAGAERPDGGAPVFRVALVFDGAGAALSP